MYETRFEQLETGGIASSLQDKLIPEDKVALSDNQLFQKVENHLLHKIQEGDDHAIFLLGQFYIEEGFPEQAAVQFEKIKETDYQAAYQLGTMYFDGLGVTADYKKGRDLMMRIASSKTSKARHLKYSAQYNVGCAYFQGYGVQQSDAEAEKWWLLAADDGSPQGSVLAQTMLGMFYSQPDTQDLKKAFFWHSEACGNGGLESQGILGVMYLFGYGIARSDENALICLKEASQRGNVYAQGRLIQFYYSKKLYTKACDLARRVVAYTDSQTISQETSCLRTYINKGICLACIYLSRCLAVGNGIKKNEEEAKKYFDMATDLDPVMSNNAFIDVAFGFL